MGRIIDMPEGNDGGKRILTEEEKKARKKRIRNRIFGGLFIAGLVLTGGAIGFCVKNKTSKDSEVDTGSANSTETEAADI